MADNEFADPGSSNWQDIRLPYRLYGMPGANAVRFLLQNWPYRQYITAHHALTINGPPEFHSAWPAARRMRIARCDMPGPMANFAQNVTLSNDRALAGAFKAATAEDP